MYSKERVTFLVGFLYYNFIKKFFYLHLLNRFFWDCTVIKCEFVGFSSGITDEIFGRTLLSRQTLVSLKINLLNCVKRTFMNDFALIARFSRNCYVKIRIYSFYLMSELLNELANLKVRLYLFYFIFIVLRFIRFFSTELCVY